MKEKQHITDSLFISMEEMIGEPLSHEEATAQLMKDPNVYNSFLSCPKEIQDELLSFIMGESGLYITYDAFFKRIMSPNLHPRRLESFLSAVLNTSVTIIDVVPNEGFIIRERNSLVIMDIIVKTIDGAIINVEMQKIGHSFPGQRTECYVADSIMRQYNTARDELGKSFSYNKIRPAYLIVLMEDSPNEFIKAAPNYMHIRKVVYDTGISLPTLENICIISLDTFNKVMQNKTITNELEAWLTFFSCTDMKRINQLISDFPEFVEIYKEIWRLRLDMEELINMFSRSLAEADYYNELSMIREFKAEAKALAAEIEEKKAEIADKDAEIADKDAEIAMLLAEIEKLRA
ncbi:MAG: PD-(D/E)XK nuclease family transposase [Lachnospiraceae bacterium]|nr:PD-(D/E)XK nuclease family transposase [Candidatus Colinaster scatohippi]